MKQELLNVVPSQWGQHTVGAARGGGGRDKKTTLEGDGWGWGHVWAHGEEWAPREQTDVGHTDAYSRWTQDTETHTSWLGRQVAPTQTGWGASVLPQTP